MLRGWWWVGHLVSGNLFFAVSGFLFRSAKKKSRHGSAQLAHAKKKSRHGSAQLAMRKKNPDMAPEPGQSHTKSHEIILQVHFTASTVLRKILTLPWAKNPDTAAGRILRKKSRHGSAELAMRKKIQTRLWQLAELGNSRVWIFFRRKIQTSGNFARSRMPWTRLTRRKPASASCAPTAVPTPRLKRAFR